jgi:hypothetical protein
MKKTAFALITLCLLNGCVKTYTWTKDGASNAEFYKAKSYCQAISTGATPMVYAGPSSSTTYHNGSVYSSSGTYGSYNGTSTTYYNNTGQAFANLGQTIQRQNMFNDCMRGEGWLPQGELSFDSEIPASERKRDPKKRGDATPLKNSLPITLSDLPYEGSKVVHTITSISMLEIVGRTDDYYEVKTANEKYGWSLKSNFQELISENTSPLIDKKTEKISKKAMPIKDRLPVIFYRESDSGSSVAYTLNNLSTLKVLDEAKAMLLVEDEEKHWGWVLKENVEIID